MRIGIVADIHEAVAPLRACLSVLKAHDVDKIVSLGDACDMFSAIGRAAEVVALLRDAGAVGVWGNHDIGLCHHVSDSIRARTDPEVLEWMAGMQPQLVLDGCRFSHVEPWLDACDVQSLWYFEGPPDTPDLVCRSFAAVPERYLFIGHFHRWLAATPAGPLPWRGEGPLDLSSTARCLVVVAPVFDGRCAVFDTATRQLLPLCPLQNG